MRDDGKPGIPARWGFAGSDRCVEGIIDPRDRWSRDIFALCIEHRTPIIFAKLRCWTTPTPCSAACTHAEGKADECRCLCGGTNHGAETR